MDASLHQTAAAAVSNGQGIAVEMMSSPRKPAQDVTDSNGGPPSAAAASPTDRSAYASFLRSLSAAWTDAPSLSVSYANLRVEHRVAEAASSPEQQAAKELPTVPRTMLAQLASLDPRSWRGSQHQTRALASIASASGVHMPGSMTLVLAPPGAGKSTLLRALAGRLTGGNASTEVTGEVTGELRWNGMTAEELAASGVHLNKLTALVDQSDVHYPVLTVRETLAFAADNSMPDIALLGNDDLVKQRQNLVQAVIDMMGLTECSETIVGNTAVRGVSGGQRRRVSVAEMLMGCPRMLLLDEITSGLDASTAYDIVRAMREWSRIMNGAVTMALLQPAPEIVDLFDQLVLMREGYVVFSGTQAQLRDHIKSITGSEPPSHEPLAEWVVKWLAQPSAGGSTAQVVPVASSPPHSPQGVIPALPVHSAPQLLSASPSDPAVVRFHMDEGNENALDDPPAAEPLLVVEGAKEAESGVAVTAAPVIDETRARRLARTTSSSRVSVMPPVSTALLVSHWQRSPLYSQILMEVAQLRQSKSPLPTADAVTPFTRAQLYQPSSHSFAYHGRLLLVREFRAVMRNEEVVWYRVTQAIVLGLIVGSLFFDLGSGPTSVTLRISLCFLNIMTIAFGSMSEVPAMIEFKSVVLKQHAAGMFGFTGYVLSAAATALPVSMVESFIFGTLLYWMCNYVASAGHYFFYLFTMLLTGLALGGMFRVVAFVVRSPDVAISVVMPIASIQILFAGFLITKDKIANWLIEFYWANPFTWATNTLVLNEFKSNRYTPEEGYRYLATYQIPSEWEYKWGGIAFLAGFFLVMTAIAGWVLSRSRGDTGTRGARRVEEVHVQDNDDDAADHAHVIELEATPRSPMDAGAALPFEKAALSFTDVCYSVEVDADDPGADATAEGAKKTKKVQRQLLRGVTGYAAPGTITALMGSSGAGKTTLLDCLAGRKTQGTLTGSILVNGAAPTLASRGMLGYVQQQDEHFSLTTVREAVQFSAQLRLPASVTQAQRDGFVNSILRDLELTALADRLVGDLAGHVPGLAPGERKRLTIAVELAANPPILFLDEPTTGLDARAALVVLRVLHKIAARGRSVVCTIHQPSRELFLMFDRLLLLQPGGRCVYFGDVGRRGQSVVDHFTGLQVQPPIEPPADEGEDNVAVWMLTAIRSEVALGAEDDTGKDTQKEKEKEAALTAIPPFAQMYADSALAKRNAEQQDKLAHDFTRPASSSTRDSVYMRSVWHQFLAVLARMLVVWWRSGPLQLSKLTSCVVQGIVLGVVYYQINDDDEAGMVSKIAALFGGVAFAGMVTASSAIPPMYNMREAFYRETASNTYKEWVHAVCCILVELPWTALAAMLFVLPFYFLMGLRADAGMFFHYYLVVLLICLIFVSLNQLFTSISPNAMIAVMLSDLIVTVLFLFAGLFVPEPDIPVGWQWMYYICPYPKALIAVSLPQWRCDEETGEGHGCGTVDTLDGVVSKKEYVHDFMGSGDGWEYYYIGWLVLTMVVIQVAFVYATVKVSFRSR